MTASTQAEYGEPNRVSVEEMLREIANQSHAVEACLDQVAEQVEGLDAAALRGVQRVHLTGCGDSYFAGLAARMAFGTWAGLPSQAIEALELGRYDSDTLDGSDLVVAVSNSGKATRTVEALRAATAAGALSLAVTGAPESALGHAGRLVLNQRVERDGRALTMPSNLDPTATSASFGLANYLVSLTTLLLLALRLGELRGRLDPDERREVLAELRAAGAAVDATAELCEKPARELAERFAERRELMILGAGPGLAMALFAGAKTYELARLNGNVQQLEEWAHEQFFLTGPGTQLLMVAPPGRASSRYAEIVWTAAQLGAEVSVITEADAALPEGATLKLPVAGSHTEQLVGIPYVVPGELFATFAAGVRGRDAFEFDSDLQYVLNMRTIQESRIWPDEVLRSVRTWRSRNVAGSLRPCWSWRSPRQSWPVAR